MHILWVPSWYPSADEPLNGSFFAEQRRMLIDAGHRVGVLNVNARSLWQQRQQVWFTKVDEDVYRRDVPTIPLEIVPGDVAIIRLLARRLARQYERGQGKPDVIHAHSAFPGVLVAHELARVWNVPFGFTEHRPSSAERNQNKGRFKAIKQAVQASAFNVTVSQMMAEQQGELYSVEPFLTCALPAPAVFFAQHLSEPSPEAITFVHVSHMDRNKRVKETIEAFARVHDEYPRTSLVLIGGSNERVTELRDRYSAISESLQILGQVQRQEIAQIMAQGDCLVLVSEQEAGGTVMAEAQCLGMAVLASATPAGTFMVRPETGIVVPIDDPDALVEAMRDVIEGFKTGRFTPATIRAQARERFSEHAFVAFHEECYQKAIGN